MANAETGDVRPAGGHTHVSKDTQHDTFRCVQDLHSSNVCITLYYTAIDTTTVKPQILSAHSQHGSHEADSAQVHWWQGSQKTTCNKGEAVAHEAVASLSLSSTVLTGGATLPGMCGIVRIFF